MKKILLGVAVLSLAGCAEKQEYEQAVLEQMKVEKDLQDYKIAPERMADCVVETSSSKMPGLFPFDPQRLTAYKNYAKMLKLNTSTDPKKTLEELRTDFGSPKNLADAHSNYTEAMVDCIQGLITSTEQEETKQESK